MPRACPLAGHKGSAEAQVAVQGAESEGADGSCLGGACYYCTTARQSGSLVVDENGAAILMGVLAVVVPLSRAPSKLRQRTLLPPLITNTTLLRLLRHDFLPPFIPTACAQASV